DSGPRKPGYDRRHTARRALALQPHAAPRRRARRGPQDGAGPARAEPLVETGRGGGEWPAHLQAHPAGDLRGQHPRGARRYRVPITSTAPEVAVTPSPVLHLPLTRRLTLWDFGDPGSKLIPLA